MRSASADTLTRSERIEAEPKVPKTVREVIAVLEAHGWVQIRQRGSHRTFKHPDRPAVITVAGGAADTIKRGTLADIRRKSGLEHLR